MKAFRLTAENACLFYEVCLAIGAETEEQKLAVLDAMVVLGKVEQVTETNNTKEEYIEHLSKHFKVGTIGYRHPTSPKEKNNG